MVLMAGRGSYMMAGRQTAAAAKAFEALVARYPETPNVHYAYGVYLLIEQPAQAIEEFKRELNVQPNDSETLMQIAYEYLKETNAAEALPWAQQAVDAAPNSFASHRALGEALVETGDTAKGISHLELAVKLAPDSPSAHFALAKAYQRVGRTADASREREEFTRLDRLARTNRNGAQSVGGQDTERPQPAPPGSSQQQ
jgi:tetratricopeptide (TPR) repeat protein